MGDCHSIQVPSLSEMGNHDGSCVDANVNLTYRQQGKQHTVVPAPHRSSHGNEWLVGEQFVVRKNF